MRSRGFTLIELLAVIVILAIIALIATPIVINIISDAKKSSQEESIKMYAKAIEDGVANYFLRNPNKKEVPTIEELQEGKYINYKGNVDCEETKIYPNGKIYLDKCTVDGTQVTYTYGEKEKTLCTLDGEKTGTEEINIGDKYKCEVKPGMEEPYTFYVLTDPVDGKVNLIMDRNICNDGTISYTSGNNYCRYKWYSSANNNTYGPTTVMAELYAGTKDWDNVEDMVMNYTDENNGSAEDKGFTSIITSNGVTTITGKPTTNTTTVGTSAKPLKARIPKESEVTGAGCTTSSGSCPTWLMENMTYYNVSNDKYSMNNNSEAYQNQIYGYWLLSSSPGYSSIARRVYSSGRVSSVSTTSGDFGARPVITVSTSDLSS